jgi:hypothetical protein
VPAFCGQQRKLGCFNWADIAKPIAVIIRPQTRGLDVLIWGCHRVDLILNLLLWAGDLRGRRRRDRRGAGTQHQASNGDDSGFEIHGVLFRGLLDLPHDSIRGESNSFVFILWLIDFCYLHGVSLGFF